MVPTATIPTYSELQRSIDWTRLRHLQDSAPNGPPAEARPLLSTAGRELLLWEQSGKAQELYLPPNARYNVFLRVAAAAPVVQWREGILDVRMQPLGEIAIVPPSRAMYFRTFGPSLNIHFIISPGALAQAIGKDSPSSASRLRNCFGDRDPVIEYILRALIACEASADGHGVAVLEALYAALTMRLLERYAEHRPESPAALSAEQRASIDAYIDARMAEDITLEQLAGLVGMTPYGFHRACKAVAGLPPMRYVMRRRMQRARDLVEGSRMLLADIAVQVGLPDPAHFTNAFRKHWGVAPSRMRGG